MRKALILSVVILLALPIFGCSSQSTSSNSTQSSSVSQESVVSQGTLTQEQKNEIKGYLDTKQMIDLDNAISEATDGLMDLVSEGNVDEIDRRFFALSNAVEEAEKVNVPTLCKNLHYYKLQSGRALTVALGDLSKAIGSSSDATELINEASSYIDQATGFMNDYDEEAKRLAELAK